MWQDDEDNNPYGSFNNQDPANPSLSTACKNLELDFGKIGLGLTILFRRRPLRDPSFVTLSHE
jgi:hypothetical protein